MEEFNLQKEVADKYSLRGRVFTKIREDILAGVYKENEELKEAILGKELGV
ncbi:MAG TPA: GntR family transcriptional regulator, partial [Lachnospiraceae bacterium]|nr:GntR family transcriptional regulator [Lachnospiraceae bacterium]